jgi:hypothetical protein
MGKARSRNGKARTARARPVVAWAKLVAARARLVAATAGLAAIRARLVDARVRLAACIAYTLVTCTGQQQMGSILGFKTRLVRLAELISLQKHLT